MTIPVARPFLPPESTVFAKDAIDSGWLSSRGEYVERATETLKAALGFKHVVLTNSGTAAGHLCAIILRRLYPDRDRRIICPNNVYVAAWNTLRQEYPAAILDPIEPDEETWQADYKSALINERLDALLVVHNIAGTVNVAAIRRRLPHLKIIEDCCEGMFGTYEGQSVGSLALAASVSFFGNKTITAGGGGAVLTNDDRAAFIARRVANQGATSERYVHDVPGYHYAMTNVQAALLYGQLLLRERIRSMKRRIFDVYRAALPGGRIVVQETEPGTTSSDWMMGVRIMGSPGFDCAERFMTERGIEVRPMFPPITRHRHLSDVRVNGTAVAERLHRECIILPSYPELTDGEIGRVVDAVRGYARSI
jgi:perosamine synthetase